MYLIYVSGYSYVSIVKEPDYHVIPTYRPEIGNDIWNGFISIDPFFPSGEGWDAFAQRCIDESRHPMWPPYSHLPANASTLSVNTWAGNVQATHTNVKLNLIMICPMESSFCKYMCVIHIGGTFVYVYI